MSFSKIHSAQISHLSPKPVDIEVDISRGLYSFTIVGLGDKAVEEARDRVSSAIKNTGFKAPKQKSEKVVVSLAPAYSKKHGPLFDVAIALGYLEAAGEIDITEKNKRLFLGELALDGSLRYVHGALPLTKWAKEKGYKEIFIPEANAKEAAVIEGISVYGVRSLWDIIQHVKPNSSTQLIKQPTTQLSPTQSDGSVTLDDIKGHHIAKRGLLIAASGAHNVALFGPPGTGKTLLAKALQSITPNMTQEEMFSVTSIYSSSGQLQRKESVVTERPFRAPHHSASYAAMCGGGTNITPGEITLAHNGILFLDELPEFERKVIDSLRQPLEDGVICISRASGSVTYPADFILIATLNPCPCGYKDTGIRSCSCSPSQTAKYAQKISGPIVDRIDMWIEVGSVNHEELLITKVKKGGINTAKTLATKTQITQKERQNKLNGQLHAKEIEDFIELSKPVISIIKDASEKLELSARAIHKIIKIARTIADLEMKPTISEQHILEALQFRKTN